MNLVFGSEVALLGFWEYMFQILFRVNARIQSLKTSVFGLFFFRENLVYNFGHCILCRISTEYMPVPTPPILQPPVQNPSADHLENHLENNFIILRQL